MSELLIGIINDEVENEEKKNIWENSKFKDIVKLQSNNVGRVGERYIQELCNKCGIISDCDGSKTKKIGGGCGDGHINNHKVEIKTAVAGSSNPNNPSFQHELGEFPWQYGEFLIFVDISPVCIYITIFTNFTETIYKSSNKLPSSSPFPTKTVTWRKGEGNFKLDSTLKINNSNVEKGHTIKISYDTSLDTISRFLRTKFI